jgi:hypothetical protein
LVESKAFWKIALSLKRTHTRPHPKFNEWALARNILDFGSIGIQEIQKQLRRAQKELREVKQKAALLRENHLRDLLDVQVESGDDKEHEKQLRILLRAHKMQHQYKRMQQVLKPNIKGGLSYVLVPEGAQPEDFPYNPSTVRGWSMVHEPRKVEKYLMQRNKTHFGQAHGSPFTVHLLNQLDWAATSEPAEELINGSVPTCLHHKNQYVNKLIQIIAKEPALQEINTYMLPEDVARGFRKWREQTSTSPSGCHLGLRRIPCIPTNNKEIEQQRTNILGVQTAVINIPLAHGFAPKQWKTVVTAMLEKVPGTPLLHKLRVIHILEADYNLTLKAIFGRRLMQNCERHGTLGDIQDGFRKGRSTTRTLLHNEIINDYNKRRWIDSFLGMTDISGCFDRIASAIYYITPQPKKWMPHGGGKDACRNITTSKILPKDAARHSTGILL